MPRRSLGWEGLWECRRYRSPPGKSVIAGASRKTWACSRRHSPGVFWGMCGQGDPPGAWDAHVLMCSECVTLQSPHNGLHSLLYRMQSVICSPSTLGAQTGFWTSKNQDNYAWSWRFVSGILCSKSECWPLRAKLGWENKVEGEDLTPNSALHTFINKDTSHTSFWQMGKCSHSVGSFKKKRKHFSGTSKLCNVRGEGTFLMINSTSFFVRTEGKQG